VHTDTTLQAPGTPVEPTEAAAAPAPPPKRRKSLLGMVAAQQVTAEDGGESESAVDMFMQAEIERFDALRATILQAGEKHAYYQSGKRFNLFSFWVDHKSALPLHEKVFRAEVGPKKAAAANVESVFSGAGKFTDEAKSAGHKLVSRITKLHYDWKYDFLHPTSKQVVDRYNKRFRPTVHSRLVAAAAASSSAASSSTAPAPAQQ
jgi:hypothetical protein